MFSHSIFSNFWLEESVESSMKDSQELTENSPKGLTEKLEKELTEGSSEESIEKLEDWQKVHKKNQLKNRKKD